MARVQHLVRINLSHPITYDHDLAVQIASILESQHPYSGSYKLDRHITSFEPHQYFDLLTTIGRKLLVKIESTPNFQY